MDRLERAVPLLRVVVGNARTNGQTSQGGLTLRNEADLGILV